MSESRKGLAWEEDELRACVELYLRLRRLEIGGDAFVKASECAKLGEQLERDRSSVEFKMCSISYVLSLHGRYWIQGWKPRPNAGVNVALTLERLISGVENRKVESSVEFVNRLEKVSDAAPDYSLNELPTGNARPRSKEIISTSYERSVEVAAFVLARAKGICECCLSPSPFDRADGSPYLEVHHVIRLADEGADTPANAVAVCPNCHRELHFGQRKFELMKLLMERAPSV